MTLAELSWHRTLHEKGYIPNLNVNYDTLAVISPFVNKVNRLYTFDTKGNEPSGLLQHPKYVSSVAVTGYGELLLVRSLDSIPEVFILKDNKEHFFKWDSLPPYDKEVAFGKTVLIQEQKQALIAGVSDRFDTKGFLVLADWNDGLYNGRLSVIDTGIDEAPHDLAIINDHVYIATGRGGYIEIINFSKRGYIPELVPYNTDVFKPMRVVTWDSYVVAASYNQLFWWKDRDLIHIENICGYNDIINGLAVLPRYGIICTLTYSDQLVIKHGPEERATPIKTSSFDLKRPCWVVTDPNIHGRVYVTGHSSGDIWAINLL